MRQADAAQTVASFLACIIADYPKRIAAQVPNCAAGDLNCTDRMTVEMVIAPGQRMRVHVVTQLTFEAM